MNIPKTIGIIMDGNRRWAKAHNLPTFMGHSQGYETLEHFLRWAKDAGVSAVIAYAFSHENWNRSKEEVEFMMNLLRDILTNRFEKFLEEKVKVVFAGDVERFPKDIADLMRSWEEKTKAFTDFTLVMAVSYGGRQEILRACSLCTADGIAQPTEEDIAERLYTKHIADPDIVIRTSGEMRLSGFLLWQASYSELFFTKTLWPDFSKEEFLSILKEFNERERRMGV